ncbi:hypothetical protein MMC22_010959 [Lobaria immixta]|nr:hypothetical protein [Lobaria immixta]
MRLPMLSGAAFLACGILVSSRALSIRQEVQSLYGDPSWWNGGKLPSSNPPITPSLPTLPNTNYELASTLPFNTNLDGLSEFNPQIPTQSGLDPPTAPSIDSSFQIATTVPAWFKVLYLSFISIKNGECEYGIYVIDTDTTSLVVKECRKRSDRSNWKDLSDSLTRSGPAYAIVHLENGTTLCITSFIDDGSIPTLDFILLQASLLAARNPLLKLVQDVFPGATDLGVNSPEHLAQLMSQYDTPKRCFCQNRWYKACRLMMG